MVGRSQEAAPIRREGVVLSHPMSRTTPSIGLPRMDSSTSMLARLRKNMAVGRNIVSPRDMTGNSRGKPPASQTPRLHIFGNLAKVSVAWSQFRPCVANADHGAAVKQVPWPSLVLDPTPVQKAVTAFASEPFLTSQRFHWLDPDGDWLVPLTDVPCQESALHHSAKGIDGPCPGRCNK